MRALILSLTIALTGLTAHPLFAQQEKNPLIHIPSDFSLLVKLSSPGVTLKRSEESLEAAAPGMGGLVGTVSAMVGEIISNPDLAGTDQLGDFWMALKFKAGEDPVRVFLIPSKTPKELQEAVGEGFTFFNQGRWVIYSESSEAIELFQKLKKGEGRPLNKFVDATSLDILEKGDLAIWVELPTLRRAYKEEIDYQKTQVEDFLKELPHQISTQQGIDPEQVSKLYNDIFQFFTKGMEDSRAFCGSISCQKGGVFADSYLAFSFSSETSKQLKLVTPSDFRGLTKLPQSHVVYAGISGVSADFLRWTSNLSSAMLDEKHRQSMAAAMEEMIGLKMGPMVWSMDIGGQAEGVMKLVSQIELAEPQKLKALNHKIMAELPEFEQQGLVYKQTLQPEAESVGAYKADLLSTSIKIKDPTSPQGMIQQQILGMMYGPEGITTRTFYLEDRVLQVVGNAELAMEAITAFEGKPPTKKSRGESTEETDGTGSSFGSSQRKSAEEDEDEKRPSGKTGKPNQIKRFDDAEGGIKLNLPKEDAPQADTEQNPEASTGEPNPSSRKSSLSRSSSEIVELPDRDVRNAMKLTRGKLSTRANFILMLDLPAILVKALQRVPFVQQLGISMRDLVEAIQTPSFTGISLGAETSALRCKLMVPTDQMKGIGQVVTVFMPLIAKFSAGEQLLTPPPAEAPPTDSPPTQTPGEGPPVKDDAEGIPNASSKPADQPPPDKSLNPNPKKQRRSKKYEDD